MVVKCLPGMHEVLGAIVSTGSREKHQIQLQCPEVMCVGPAVLLQSSRAEQLPEDSVPYQTWTLHYVALNEKCWPLAKWQVSHTTSGPWAWVPAQEAPPQAHSHVRQPWFSGWRACASCPEMPPGWTPEPLPWAWPRLGNGATWVEAALRLSFVLHPN